MRSRDHKVLSKLRRDARRIARHFKLRYAKITTETPRTTRCGSCDENHVIRIRLRVLRDRSVIRYHLLVDTLCHELAHLMHFSHGPEFKDFYQKILDWARQRKIYSPPRRK